MAAMDSEELMTFLVREFPQIGHLNIEVQATDGKGGVSFTARADDQHLRPGGTVSGPTMMALADCGAYLSILSVLGPVALAVTTNLNINFLRKPAPGPLRCECDILKLGKRLVITEATIYSGDDDDPVAHATATYSVPPVVA